MYKNYLQNSCKFGSNIKYPKARNQIYFCHVTKNNKTYFICVSMKAVSDTYLLYSDTFN